MSTRANAIRSAAQEDAGHPDNLRTALRHVPLLPPPANVEDLVGRLGGESEAHASADVAEIILDARHPDIPQERLWFSDLSRQNLFAEISAPANTNAPDRSRLPSFLLNALFVAGALVAAYLITTYVRCHQA